MRSLEIKHELNESQWLSVYELSENQAEQQPRIDRAEEDLLCAISLFRRGACGYLPLNNICYLLLQAIEKWLKLLIAVRGIPAPARGQNAHNLRSFFEAIAEQEPRFATIRDRMETMDGELLDHRFPGKLRYEELPQVDRTYIKTLLVAAFETRRIVKQCLKQGAL